MILSLGLVVSSVVVWNSPSNPVTQVVASLTSDQLEMKRLASQRDTLVKQVTALQQELLSGKVDLKLSRTERAAIQQQLWSVQGQVDAMTAALSARPPAQNPRTPTFRPAKPPTVITPAGISAPSKGELLNPTSRYFGLFTDQAPFNYASFDAVSAKLESQPGSVGYFGGWDQNFRGDVVTSAWKREQLPILTWESRPILANNGENSAPAYSLPKIIGGDFDAYLHQYAKDVVATGLPLGIRLDHEMNGIWYPWSETDSQGNSINSNRVGDFVKMWQHVHAIFEQGGANSLVIWIWAPNIINNLPAAHKSSSFLAGLYPGDSMVDMVGLSGYLRPPYVSENNFSFDYTFGASLAELRALSTRPIFLTEIGASETGGHKAAWISSLFSGLAKQENSDIVGFSWFNLAVTTYTEGILATNDWRIDSRPESLEAFNAGLSRERPGGCPYVVCQAAR